MVRINQYVSWYLKLVSAIFIKFLFFHQPFKNYEKCFLFHQKSSFLSRDNHIFLFLSFPLFLAVGHCFRGWSKINLTVYDAINCLNKNLIPHFVCYLDKQKRYNTESLSIDGVSKKEHFYGKIMLKIFSKS